MAPVRMFAAVLAVLLVGACGDGDENAARDAGGDPARTTTTAAGELPACDQPKNEVLDPNSSRHLLPGAPEPEYLTDPPTSGPHRTGDHPSGVLPDPIDKPVQVAMLEHGGVIIHHKDLSAAEFDQVSKLGGEQVSVAPNPVLGTKIVATAWQVKMSCRALDTSALEAFVAQYVEPDSAGH